MNWEKIIETDLPEMEVLAANFKPGTYGYKEKIIGYLYRNELSVVCCEGENEELEHASHYIDLSKHDI